MVWYVYMVQCRDGSLYTGITNNPTRRVQEHNADDKLGSKYIRPRRPVTLIYTEQQSTRSLALKRENEIKGWSRNKKIQLSKTRS